MAAPFRVPAPKRAARSPGRQCLVPPCSEGFSRGKAAPNKGKKGPQKKKKAGKSPPSAALEQQQRMLSALTAKQVEDDFIGEANSRAAVGQSDAVMVKKGKARSAREYKQVEGAIYDHPMYYDWAFGFREYESEVDFLFDVYEEMLGSEPTSFVELGCGPAQHSLEMAESNLDVYCVDLNKNMLEYAAELAAGDQLKLTCLNQDMREFELPDGKQVDLVAILLGTFQHMYTNSDAIRTLKQIYNALKPGGLCILELNHPALLFDGSVITSADTWNVDLEEAQVEVWWGHEGDVFDPISQILSKTVEIKIMMRGGEMLALNEIVPMRQFTYQELSLMAQVAGLEMKGAFGDFDMESGIHGNIASATSEDDDSDDGGFIPNMKDLNEDPYRMVAIFQKPVV